MQAVYRLHLKMPFSRSDEDKYNIAGLGCKNSEKPDFSVTPATLTNEPEHKNRFQLWGKFCIFNHFNHDQRGDVNKFFDAVDTTMDTLRFVQIRDKYSHNIKFARNLSGPLKTSQTLLFFPDRPVPSSVVYKLCARLNCRVITHPGRRFDVAVKYRDNTFFDRKMPETVPAGKMINQNVTDISKKNVDRIFGSVFGYSTVIDPLNFAGPAVEKSDKNATHDGRIIDCPVTPERVRHECIYQKVLDNRAKNNMVLDYRPVVHGDNMPLVYLKYRPEKTRFSNTNHHVEMARVEDVFSAQEQKNIIRFAQKMGIDYGEFDILRDKSDGRIYITDANITPWGPPNGLSHEDQVRAVDALTETFAALVEKFS